MESYDHIRYSIVDGRAEITLDRPDKLNAFNEMMIDEIRSALMDAEADDSVYVLLLTGNGGGFCSGADVDEEDSEVSDSSYLLKVQDVVRKLYFGEKPVIAAVNGPALGAGCDFALAADLRVMSSESFLREQFVNIGLVPGDGGGWLLPRLIGESKGMEILLRGHDIDPQEANELGLTVDVVGPDRVLARARELANELRDKPAVAVRRTKELIVSDHSFEEYCEAAIEAQREATADEEHREALMALLENREPEFHR
jgi:enoyl-CoA hydratase/carnithine racemase